MSVAHELSHFTCTIQKVIQESENNDHKLHRFIRVTVGPRGRMTVELRLSLSSSPGSPTAEPEEGIH